MTDPTKHNYFKKLLALQAQGKLSPGRLSEVDILHDDWCRIYAGGYCNCEPEIRIRTRRAARPGDPSAN